MRFENLDSMLPPDTATIERVAAASGHSLSALRKVPVFWVSEALMDKLYDPWRSVLLNPDCVDKALEAAAEKTDPEKSDEAFIRDLDRFWERLEECSGKMATVYRPAKGVYIRDLDEAAVKHIAGARRKTGKGVAAVAAGMSAVFVCPERCAAQVKDLDTSLNHAKSVELATAQVVFHELTHAWLNTDMARYRTSWGRVIEESLCEAESTLYFDDEDGRPGMALIKQLLLDGPIEYRSFRFWYWVGRHSTRYIGRFHQGSKSALEAWKRYSYEVLFDDASRYHRSDFADSLFGADFGRFAEANSSLPKARLVEIFWKQAAQNILAWLHAEEA